MELVSLQPVLLFHQLRSGLAPVWIHGDWLAKIANISFPPTHPLFHLALGLVVSITVGILEREVAVNDPLWPKCGANCCQWVVYNHWLYWQPALLPGGLWQHFSSIPTFLLPRARQCFHPEVNIDEVTLSTLSMLFHNKTCTRSAMESVIEIAGANRDYGRSVPWVD